MNNPRYWVCVIGPVPDECLPDGADYPPRIAARENIEIMTGIDTCLITSSSWISQEEYERIEKARFPNL